MKLLGTSLLITGAAGRVGSATARLALAEGAQIILSDISEKKLEELKIELDSLGYGKVHSIKSDVTTEDGIGKLLVTAQRFSSIVFLLFIALILDRQVGASRLNNLNSSIF